MDTVRWLVVGTGDIVRKRVGAALRGAPRSALTAVCSGRPENARAFADEFDVAEVFPDLATALRDTSAEAVYLATPVGLHLEQAEAALEAGKHVLVEKPLAIDGTQARALAASAAASGLKAGCAYYRRCSARYAHAKAMLESGEFGRCVLVRMVCFSWFSPGADDPKRWRVVRSQSGGGPMADMGSHMLDILIGLFGMPRTVSANCATLCNDWDVEDSAAIVMSLADGALVTASFNWNSRTWRHEFEIVGTEAKVSWAPFDTGAVVKTVGRDSEELDLPPADNVHLPLVADFVDAVLDDREPVSPVSDAARTNVLMDAVYRSAAEGVEVEVAEM